MLSDQVKGRQARKRFAELAAAQAKGKDYEIGAAAAYDAQEADLQQKPGRPSQQATGRYEKLKQF
jgi:hypothetical protein